MDAHYARSLSEQITSVLAVQPELSDHRKDHPWLIGALGSDVAHIVFVGENPSLTQVERATDPHSGGPPTIESQWWQTDGDKLFRESLIECGFKSGSIASTGDWNCYITNVIKQPDYAEKWKKKSISKRCQFAEKWAPVLRFELSKMHPKLVVAMGDKAYLFLQHLIRNGLIPRYPVHKVWHYSYVGQRADAKRRLGPMNPVRVQEYKDQIRNVAELADSMSG